MPRRTPEPHGTRISPLPSILGLLGLAAIALLVRGRHLGNQLLGGDELHLLRVVSGHSAGEILGLVTDTDFSIPLALVAKAAAGVAPLSEWSLRLPVLVLGGLAPVLFTAGARRFVPREVAVALGLVVVVHPLFVFYGRFARPYGLCVLLLFGVLLLLDRAAATRRRAPLGLAAGLGALASWIHLPALLTAGLLFGGAIVRAALQADDRPRAAARPAAAGALCLVLTLLLYAPALGALEASVLAGNLGLGRLDAEILWRNAAVLAGAPGRGPFLAGLLLAAVGAAHMLRQDRERATLLLVPALGVPCALLALRPALVEFAFVLARYSFYVLPIWLLFACSGARALLGFLPKVRRSAPVALSLVAAAGSTAWLAFGPYAAIYNGSASYAHHNAYQTFAFRSDSRWRSAARRSLLAPVPGFYRSLAEGEGLVLEGPAPESFHDNPLALYQRYHRRPIRLLATKGSFWSAPELALENVVVLRADEAPDFGDARLAIVHKSVPAELIEILGETPSAKAARVHDPRVVAALSERLAELCGEPLHEDERVLVYALPSND